MVSFPQPKKPTQHHKCQQNYRPLSPTKLGQGRPRLHKLCYSLDSAVEQCSDLACRTSTVLADNITAASKVGTPLRKGKITPLRMRRTLGGALHVYLFDAHHTRYTTCRYPSILVVLLVTQWKCFRPRKWDYIVFVTPLSSQTWFISPGDQKLCLDMLCISRTYLSILITRIDESSCLANVLQRISGCLSEWKAKCRVTYLNSAN